MGPGSLRCRIHIGPRRRSATGSIRGFVRIFATGNPRAGCWISMAVRLRSGPFPWFPCVEDMVHAEGLRHSRDGSDDFADMLIGTLPGTADQEHAGTRTAGAGGTEHRMFSIPGG